MGKRIGVILVFGVLVGINILMGIELAARWTEAKVDPSPVTKIPTKHTIDEFKQVMRYHGVLSLEWNGTEWGFFRGEKWCPAFRSVKVRPDQFKNHTRTKIIDKSAERHT